MVVRAQRLIKLYLSKKLNSNLFNIFVKDYYCISQDIFRSKFYCLLLSITYVNKLFIALICVAKIFYAFIIPNQMLSMIFFLL